MIHCISLVYKKILSVHLFRVCLFTCIVMASFAFSEVHEKVFMTSLPKSGTNLLMKLLKEITGKGCYTNADNFLLLDPRGHAGTGKEAFLVCHAIASEENIEVIENRGFKGIYIYRDPRDLVVSFAYYIHALKSEWPHLAELPLGELIEELITNTAIIKNEKLWKMDELDMFQGIDTFYESYMGWIKHPLVYTTSFERLIGEKGRGKKEEQLQEIFNIASHLGYTLSNQRVQEIADKLFGNTGTFRSGQIGSWNSHFTERHKQLFKNTAGQLIIDLGYEKDSNW